MFNNCKMEARLQGNSAQTKNKHPKKHQKNTITAWFIIFILCYL